MLIGRSLGRGADDTPNPGPQGNEPVRGELACQPRVSKLARRSPRAESAETCWNDRWTGRNWQPAKAGEATRALRRGQFRRTSAISALGDLCVRISTAVAWRTRPGALSPTGGN
jgi:hypothetical protein